MKQSVVLFFAIIVSAASGCMQGGFKDKTGDLFRYAVVYDANGATGGTVPTDVNSYLPSTFVKVMNNSGNLVNGSLNFAGWNTAADGKGATYGPGETFRIKGDAILYAQWSEFPVAVSTLAGHSYSSGDGVGTSAGFKYPNGVTSDGAYLYVADSENFSIRKIVPATGEVTTLAGNGFPVSADGFGTNASFFYPKGITTDGANLYVSDSSGSNKICKIVIATGEVTTLAGSGAYGSTDGTGTAASFNSPAGITTDGLNLYVADSGSNAIRKIVIATGEVTTLAGSGAYGSADGTGANASFYNPTGITTDGTNLYIADSGNHKIRKIVIATGEVTTLAGSGAYGGADGTGANASFYNPTGITTDGVNLYVADLYNYRIRQIVIATGDVTTLAGGINGSADGTGTGASFSNPSGIALCGSNLYVTESCQYGRVRCVNLQSAEVTTIAGSYPNSADGTGAAAGFNNPLGIAAGGDALFVADNQNFKIRQIQISSGAVSTLAGSGQQATVNGTGANAAFLYPKGIATDGTSLYVTDSYSIRVVDIASGTVTTLAGGNEGSSNGTGLSASFRDPHDIVTDGVNLYVADTANHMIRKIVIATGEVTTLAGSTTSGKADGTGSAASFYCPYGLAIAGGDLYVADTQNYLIRKIVIATGQVTTLAGSGLSGAADGVGTEAAFGTVNAMTSDGTHLYVCEAGYPTVRAIDIATARVVTFAGTGAAGLLNGIAKTARFSFPNGIAVVSGCIYVSDTGNNVIRKIE